MRDSERAGNRNARSVLQHQSGHGISDIVTPENRLPDFIIFPAAGQPIIAGMLMSGRENAQTARELAAALGTTERRITAAVRHDRLVCRIPILSTTNAPAGFFLPDSAPDAAAAQIAEQRERLLHRAKKILALVKVFGPAEMDGQESLFEYGPEEREEVNSHGPSETRRDDLL